MKLYWVDPNHRQAPVCEHFASLHGFYPPKDSLYLLCLDKEGTILGLTVLNSDPVDPCILFIYVTKENRHKHIGSEMLGEIISCASKAGLRSLRIFFEPDMALNSFLKKNEFEIFPGPIIYKTTLRALSYSRQYVTEIDGHSSENACTISETGEFEKEILEVFFEREGIDWQIGYDENFSVAMISGTKVQALILCDTSPGRITISHFFSDSDDNSSLLACLQVLNNRIKSIDVTYQDLTLLFYLDRDKCFRLIEALVGSDIHIIEQTETTIAVKLL
jgi:hypothetical protein